MANFLADIKTNIANFASRLNSHGAGVGGGEMDLEGGGGGGRNDAREVFPTIDLSQLINVYTVLMQYVLFIK
jgi:hypothetical protein